MAAIDLIKSYLIGIGFQVDEDSINKTKKSMDEADKTINKFNKNSQEGFSGTNDTLKGLFNLFKSSENNLGKMFPELQKPFNALMKDIVTIKKLYNDVSKIKVQGPEFNNEPNEKQSENHSNGNNNNPSSKKPSIIPQNTKSLDSSKNLVDGILNAKDATKGLATEGGEAFGMLSSGAVEATGAVAGLGVATGGIAIAVAAVALGVAELVKYLNDLAKHDIEYEKLSRQLWTTKENAKEVDMALKTMGATMQDLWLSPTLLKQFNQLRKDSKELKLPKEYTDNLKIVQGIGLEFKRLRQLGQLAFQWIGNYILKYAAGPLKEIKQGMKDFNNWFIKNIPGIAKQIGIPIGILIRGISDIIQLFALIIKTSPFGQLIKWINSLPEPVKNTMREISILIQPLLFILALLDDVMTYFKGGKSLTGTFVDKVAKAFDGMGQKIKNVIDWFKKLKDEILNSSLVKWIESVGQWIENIWQIIQNGIKIIKDLLTGDFKGLLGDINVKVKDFSNPNMNKIVSSYATSNTSNVSKTTTQNSNNNTVKNENKIYVYGSGDANSTGKAVNKNLNGITLRTVQGGY